MVIALAAFSISTLHILNADAAWIKDCNGWWNTEKDNSYSIGWKEIDGEWYYFDNNGYMMTGWILYGGNWYYLYDSGKMAKETDIDGYKLDSNGVWIESIKNYNYKKLDELEKNYSVTMAKNNGHVVSILGNGISNLDKLNTFIENYKSKKLNIGDMVRITAFEHEGNPIIYDLIADSKNSITLMEDASRDRYSSKEDRQIKSFKIQYINKSSDGEYTDYYAKTDEITLNITSSYIFTTHI